MEKLLNLLNEYMFVDTSVCEHLYNKDVETIYVRTTLETGEIDDERVRDERIISKRFGFIKRLVDNDKIQKEGGICPRKDLVKEIIIEDRETNKPIGYKNAYTEYEQLLMYLAIQDEPLTFLINILK